MVKHLYQKGHKKFPGAGRAKGTLNKRTLEVRSTLEMAAERIGGLERLIAWIKKSPDNEYIFWSSMYMRLLPVQVQGSGQNGALVLEIKKEELEKKLEERGLPKIIFGVDKPLLELKAELETLPEGNGSDHSSNGKANGGNGK